MPHIAKTEQSARAPLPSDTCSASSAALSNPSLPVARDPFFHFAFVDPSARNLEWTTLIFSFSRDSVARHRLVEYKGETCFGGRIYLGTNVLDNGPNKRNIGGCERETYQDGCMRILGAVESFNMRQLPRLKYLSTWNSTVLTSFETRLSRTQLEPQPTSDCSENIHIRPCRLLRRKLRCPSNRCVFPNTAYSTLHCPNVTQACPQELRVASPLASHGCCESLSLWRNFRALLTASIWPLSILWLC